MHSDLKEYPLLNWGRAGPGRTDGRAVIFCTKALSGCCVIWAWFWFNLCGPSAARTASASSISLLRCWLVIILSHPLKKVMASHATFKSLPLRIKVVIILPATHKNNVIVVLPTRNFPDTLSHSPSNPEKWVWLFILYNKGIWNSDVPLNHMQGNSWLTGRRRKWT